MDIHLADHEISILPFREGGGGKVALPSPPLPSSLPCLDLTNCLQLSKNVRYNKNMEIEKLIQSRKEQILSLARKNGAYDVRVFGSVARGEARPDSDIDFLVKLEAGRSLLDLARFLRELQTLLGMPVDVVTEAGLRPRIRLQVLKDARPL
jgi:predicted nucleotidyltransferase